MSFRESVKVTTFIPKFVQIIYTVRKVSKYGVFCGPNFPVFGLNTEIYSVNFRIQSKQRKIQTRKYSVFGHISRSATSYFKKRFPDFFMSLLFLFHIIYGSIIKLAVDHFLIKFRVHQNNRSPFICFLKDALKAFDDFKNKSKSV